MNIYPHRYLDIPSSSQYPTLHYSLFIVFVLIFIFNDTATPEIYTLSLHDALPISVTQFCRKLAAERPLKDIRDEYNYPKKKGIKDECSRLLEASTMKSRRGFAIQRLMNAMRQAHADGWFIVFDTLTLADD